MAKQLPRTWIFKNNAKLWDGLPKYRAEKKTPIEWSVVNHQVDLSTPLGHEVYIWYVGDSRMSQPIGIMFRGTIISKDLNDLRKDPSDHAAHHDPANLPPIVNIETIGYLDDSGPKEMIRPIEMQDFGGLDDLLRRVERIGTNFRVTDEEAVALDTLWRRRYP